MTLFQIGFLVFLIGYITYETLWGLFRYKKMIQEIKNGDMSKTKFYYKTIVGLWIPTVVVMVLILFGFFSLDGLGLQGLNINSNSLLFYVFAVLTVLYFVYLVYSLIALRINAIQKKSIKQKIPEEIKTLLPITKKEKHIWILTAFTAGICEEVLFRGVLIYMLSDLFPNLHNFIILLIAALIFGIGHIYQGLTEAIKPMILGLIFGFIYISFGTIIPGIVLHVMQDLCATEMINEE